jgi:hypothetical protein
MRLQPNQANAVTGGIWLIGMGILFATGLWWPGMLVLVGLTAIVQQWANGRGWYGLHAGFWMIMVAVWALFRFNIAIFFVGLGIYVIATAFIQPGIIRKPHIDNTLE